LTTHSGMSCVKELLVIASSGLNFRQVTVCRSRRGREMTRMARHEHSSKRGAERYGVQPKVTQVC
jgi:hypothetical protein